MIKHRLKPLARAQRVPALIHRSSTSISRTLEEQLFRSAEVLSEGGCRALRGQHDSYFGSTMISIDLERLQPLFRGGLDESTCRALAEAVDGSIRVRLRAMRLARAEAARRAPERVLGTAYTETRVRLTGRQLHIDIDLEVALRVSSGSGQP